MKRIFLSALMVSIIGFATAAAQTITPFQKGDRVAIVGNSITDGGHYHSYIWLYYMTHFPYSELQIFNCGVGGDTTITTVSLLQFFIASSHVSIF